MLNTPRVVPFILVSLFVFVLDLISPQNINTSVLFIPILLLTTFIPNQNFIKYAAIGVAILTIIAPVFKPELLEIPVVVLNRAISLLGILAAYFAVRINFSANERNLAVWNQSSTGLILVNKKGEILQTSPAIQQVFGYNEGELEGMSIDALIPSRFRHKHEQHRKGYHVHPAPRSMGSGLDLYGLRKDGVEVPLEVSLSPYSAGLEDFVLVFVIDNTVRKNHLTAKSTLNAELETRVQERTHELQDTVNELETQMRARQEAQLQAQKALVKERELNEMKSSFVSMASHEFRTPLTSIASSAHLIAMYIERNDTDKIKRHTERIKHSVENLNGILGDFLSLGKLEEGHITANIGPTDLPAIVEDVREELKYQTLPGQKVIYTHKGASGIIESDGNLLKNILLNLVSNAIKYSPENSEIHIETMVQDGHATLKITDQGIGISTEEQAQLFHKFFRASNVGNIKGTGLGLFIVKNYVEMLHGSIVCRSEAGKGSTFIIEI